MRAVKWVAATVVIALVNSGQDSVAEGVSAPPRAESNRAAGGTWQQHMAAGRASKTPSDAAKWYRLAVMIARYEDRFGPRSRALFQPLAGYARLLRESGRTELADQIGARITTLLESPAR